MNTSEKVFYFFELLYAEQIIRKQVHSNCALQIKQTKVVKSIIDSQVMQTILRNYCTYNFSQKSIKIFVHRSIQIKDEKVLKSIIL